MDEYLKALFKLYEGLPRQGPGSKNSTIKALNFIKGDLPPKPMVLDIGCGCGAQTFVLSDELEGVVTAIDIYQAYLDQISQKVITNKFKSKIKCLKEDMSKLKCDASSVDLIWSEGAIYIMGFENGLRSWQSFLKPGGFLVISELSWLKENPPEEAVSYWREGYPGMKTIEANFAIAKQIGLKRIANFSLPAEDWWETYYKPLQLKIDSLNENEKSSPGMEAVLQDTQEEMAIMKKYSYFCGYEFYILKNQENNNSDAL